MRARPPVAPVIGLLFGRGPSTVLSAIWAVDVDAIEACAVRSWPHVFKEVVEALVPLPSIAYRDAPSAVLGVLGRIWIQAAGSHVLPRTIFRSSLKPRLPMCPVGLGEAPASPAPATMRPTLREHRCGSDGLSTAVAETVPEVTLARACVSRRGFGLDDQPSKALMDQVKLREHRKIDLSVSRLGQLIPAPGLFAVSILSCAAARRRTSWSGKLCASSARSS